MHEEKITHRDIKQSNILIKQGEPKLADCGFSRHESDPTTPNAGTLPYLAPEGLQKFNPNPSKSELEQIQKTLEKIDVWAFGVMMFDALGGQEGTFTRMVGLPEKRQQFILDLKKLNQETIDNAIYHLKIKPISKSKYKHIEEQIKEILEQILILDPKQRYSMRQCFEELLILFNELSEAQEILTPTDSNRKNLTTTSSYTEDLASQTPSQDNKILEDLQQRLDRLRSATTPFTITDPRKPKFTGPDGASYINWDIGGPSSWDTEKFLSHLKKL